MRPGARHLADDPDHHCVRPMVQVLRRLHGSRVLEAYPNPVAYVARREARLAFKRAFDAQWAVFADDQDERLE